MEDSSCERTTRTKHFVTENNLESSLIDLSSKSKPICKKREFSNSTYSLPESNVTGKVVLKYNSCESSTDCSASEASNSPYISVGGLSQKFSSSFGLNKRSISNHHDQNKASNLVSGSNVNIFENDNADNQYVLDSRKSFSKPQGKSKSNRYRHGPWHWIIGTSYGYRCREFQKLFNLPKHERLLTDFSCAQLDIGKMIYHGRLYISQYSLYFTSSAILWNRVSIKIPLKDICLIRKINVMLFPSGIAIETVSYKHVFCSFVSRDRSYKTIDEIWQEFCPNNNILQASLWRRVHETYGYKLDLDSDDEDYVTHILTGQNANGGTYGSCCSDNEVRMPKNSLLSADFPEVSNVPRKREAEIFSEVCDGENHVGKLVSDVRLPFSVDEVFKLLFLKSPFMSLFFSCRGYFDCVETDWIYCHETSRMIRTISFRMRISKTASTQVFTTEYQSMLSESMNGRCYQIDANVKSTGMMGANCLQVKKHYCLSGIDSTTTSVKIWCKAEFSGGVLTRSLLEKIVYSGIDEHHNCLNRMILSLTERDSGMFVLRDGFSQTSMSLPLHKTSSEAINLRNSKFISPVWLINIKYTLFFILLLLLLFNLYTLHRLAVLEHGIGLYKRQCISDSRPEATHLESFIDRMLSSLKVLERRVFLNMSNYK